MELERASSTDFELLVGIVWFEAVADSFGRWERNPILFVEVTPNEKNAGVLSFSVVEIFVLF